MVGSDCRWWVRVRLREVGVELVREDRVADDGGGD